jgi:mono/diheme cytochrome c family protein
MPASDFHGISKTDLSKMIAYLKALPAIDREPVPTKLGPLAYVLANLGQLPLLFPFEEVTFNEEPVDDVKAAQNLEYGKYLSQACTGCHGAGFGGGPIPGVPPSWPSAKNITPQGNIGKWSYEDFKKAVTEGKTPDGHQMDSQYMPWKALAAMNETEIRALYMYLRQVPAKSDGTR